MPETLLIPLDRDSSVPVFEQICTHIREYIRDGVLRPAARLPATRALAEDLGVARSTVVTAYEQLVAEGYLASRRGAGFLVCDMGQVELDRAPVRGGGTDADQHIGAPEPATALALGALEGFEGRALLPLEPGQPDMRLFPHRSWAKAVARLCRNTPEALLDGGGRAGNLALRQAIARHVGDWRGINVRPEQVLVTSGANEALAVCMHALAQPGQGIGLEDPGYQPIRRFAQMRGLRPIVLDMDEQGAKLPDTNSGCHLVALTPSHQFPLGGALSAGRRQSFVSWAAEQEGWIIEDDYDSEFRYAGRPIPAMAGFDHKGRTVYIGSFSKIFSNALRMGYIVAPPALVTRLLSAMHSIGAKASAMPQRPLADFMESDSFYRHLRRVRRHYGERHRHLIARLRSDFADFGTVIDHQAGMQVVLHLSGPFSDQEIAKRANSAGLGVEALSRYSVENTQVNGLVLGACLNTIEEQDVALTLLKTVLNSAGEHNPAGA